MSRPRKELVWEQFEQLCKIQCTKSEIAGFFHMSEDTLENRVKEITGEPFSVLYRELSESGKSSLRRSQWKSAIQNESVQMQIWLGKQMLNQSDKVQTKVDTADIKKLVIDFGDEPEHDQV